MRKALTIVVYAVVALAIAAIALIAWPRRHVLTPTRAANGIEYMLYAHVPEACRQNPCPALYILDGDVWMPTFSHIADERVRSGRMAPIVLVGIGYRDIWNTPSRRKHDFTPAFGRTPNRTGGADIYLDVLREEIIPYAEARLPISRESRGIAGHSYGGLLAIHALQLAPDLFDRYIVMSPALWFDEGKIYSQPFATAPAQRRVFLAADTPRGAQGHMARDVVRLAALLSQRSDVTVSRALIVGTDHTSMLAPAARRGIGALYAAGGAPTSP